MKTLSLLCLLPLLNGCVETSVSDGKFKFQTRRLFFQGQIEQANFTTGSNGISNASIKGYQSDSAQIAGAIAEGVAKGLKP